jgi:DNA-3-methyladenine glycosylase
MEIMRERRGQMADKNLTSGPGKLCIALDIDKSFNGLDLLGDRIWVENYMTPDNNDIAVGTRIGIDYAGEDKDHPWRFWIAGNPYLSKRG